MISLTHDNLEAQHCFPLGPELLLAQNLPTHLNQDQEIGWMPFFFPKDFIKTHLGINTENFALDDNRLLQLGKQVTALRKRIRDKSEA